MSESDNFDWLVKARASNQEVLLRLYRFVKGNSQTLQSDAIKRTVFALLVGAGFSLWRAAFLGDAERKWPAIIGHSEQLLKRLVQDNAVNYTQDRETREWMAGYYINNAQWRLLMAWQKLENSSLQSNALEKLKRFEDRGAEEESLIELWDTSHEALLDLLNALSKG